MKRKILAGLISVIIIMGSLFAYAKSQALTEQAAAVVANEAGQLLDTKIEVGRISVNSFNSVNAEDLVIYDKQGAVFAKLKNVDISFQLLKMLTGEVPLEAVKEVRLDNPIIYLTQRSIDEWNYQDFLSEEASSNDFKGRVSLVNAVAIVDLQKKILELDEANGSIDFASAPSMSFKVTSKHKEGTIKASGTIADKNQAVSLELENFKLEDYKEFIPQDMAVDVIEGTVKDTKVTLLKDGEDYKVSGQCLLRNGKVDVQGTAIEQIDSLVLFNEKNMNIYGRAKIAEQPIFLKGSTSLDVVEPILNLDVISTGFDFSEVVEAFPLAGKVAFNMHIGGKFSDPLIRGEFSIADGNASGYTLHNVKGKAAYFDKLVTIDSIIGEAFGGKFAVSGKIDTETEEYTAHVQAENIDIAAAAAVGNLTGAAGQGYADVDVYGQGTDINKLTACGRAQVDKGAYQNYSFDSLRTSFRRKGDLIDIDYATLILPQGIINADGQINGDLIKISFTGNQVGLEQLAQLQPNAQISGKIDFAGEVSRTLSHPWLTLKFKAIDGEVYGQPFERAQGEIFGDENRIDIVKTELHDANWALHEVSGDIGLKGIQPLNITIKTRRTRAENLIKLVMPEQPLTGNVDNDIIIKGSLAEPEVGGRIKITEGSYQGILINSAEGAYRFKDGALDLEDFQIISPNLEVKLQGRMSADKSLDFVVAADNIELEKLQIKTPYPINGAAKFIGRLQGTTARPIFDGKLSAGDLSFNGELIKELNGDIHFADNELFVRDLSFKHEDASFKAAVRANMNTRLLSGNVYVEHGNLEKMMNICNIDQSVIDGKLDGTVRLDGTIDRPQVQVNGKLLNGNIKSYPIETMELAVKANGNDIDIQRFEAVQGEGVLDVSGKINFDGNTNLNIKGSNIAAGLLTSILGSDAKTTGTVNFSTELTGSTDNPDGTMILEILNGGVETASFDRLDGRLLLHDNIINVENISVQKDVYKAGLKGVVPISAITGNDDEQATIKDQMDLMLSLDEADLRILPFMSKQIDWAVGETTGQLHITGTVARPLCNGELQINDGQIKVKALGLPIQNLMLALEFKNDKIELKNLSAEMGKGNIKATGTAVLDGLGFKEYNLSLKSDKLSIVNPYFTGPLNGEFTLTEERNAPKLTGQLDFADCTVDIPAIPESDSPLPKVRLDVNVNVGKKVHLLNSFLYDLYLEGKIHFGGTTIHPKTSGEIRVIRGKLYYLKTPFKIREGSAYFNQVNSFLPSLRLMADTRLDHTRIYLGVNGPADKLQIKLFSDPQMTQQEILTLLTLKSRSKSKKDQITGDELMSMVDVGLQMSFLSEMENMIRNNTGFDEFSIARESLSSSERGGSGKQEVYNMEIGKYLNDKFMVKYTKALDYDTYKYGFQYDFNDRVSMNGSINQDSTTVIGIEARIKF